MYGNTTKIRNMRFDIEYDIYDAKSRIESTEIGFKPNLIFSIISPSTLFKNVLFNNVYVKKTRLFFWVHKIKLFTLAGILKEKKIDL